MKLRTFTATILALFTFSAGQTTAQVPEKMSYQAVIRDASNQPITNSPVGMRVHILQGSEFGASSYVETHTPQTNGNGLVSLEIGSGSIVEGDFTAIDWSDGPFFIKTETDPEGGDSYSITITSQLLTVPYALYAKKAAEVEKTKASFNVIGGTFQDLPEGETTRINFTSGTGSGGTFIDNDVFSLDNDEFTAPKDGTYFFESVVTIDTRSNPPGNFYLYLSINGNSTAHLRQYSFFSGHTQARLNMPLQLSAGDKVGLEARPTSNPTSTMGANSNGTVRFSGFKID